MHAQSLTASPVRLVAAPVLCISAEMAAPGLSQLERIAGVPWSFLDLVFCGISLKILEVYVSFVFRCMLGILALDWTEATMSAAAEGIGVSLAEYLDWYEIVHYQRGFAECMAFLLGLRTFPTSLRAFFYYVYRSCFGLGGISTGTVPALVLALVLVLLAVPLALLVLRAFLVLSSAPRPGDDTRRIVVAY